MTDFKNLVHAVSDVWKPREEIHPEKSENGSDVTILRPSSPTTADTWHASDKTASWTPKSEDPHLDSPNKPDTSPHIAESKFEKHPYLRTAAGIVMVEPDKRVWVCSPTNQFGGYKCTFPKGTVDEGGNLQDTAKREGLEETGLHAKITHHLGDYNRSTSKTRFFVGQRTGGAPSKMGWESQAVHLVPIDKLHEHLHDQVDLNILADLKKHLGTSK